MSRVCNLQSHEFQFVAANDVGRSAFAHRATSAACLRSDSSRSASHASHQTITGTSAIGSRAPSSRVPAAAASKENASASFSTPDSRPIPHMHGDTQAAPRRSISSVATSIKIDTQPITHAYIEAPLRLSWSI